MYPGRIPAQRQLYPPPVPVALAPYIKAMTMTKQSKLRERAESIFRALGVMSTLWILAIAFAIIFSFAMVLVNISILGAAGIVMLVIGIYTIALFYAHQKPTLLGYDAKNIGLRIAFCGLGILVSSILLAFNINLAASTCQDPANYSGDALLTQICTTHFTYLIIGIVFLGIVDILFITSLILESLLYNSIAMEAVDAAAARV